MKTLSFTAKLRPRSLGAVSVACSLAALLPSCVDAEPRDLGLTQSSDELSVDEPSAPFLSASDEFVGHWVGGAQDPLALTEDGVTTPYVFPSGSTRIELTLELDANGYLVGHVVFGEGEPPAPPIDAEAGYPVGVAYQSLLGYDYTNSYDEFANLLPFPFGSLPPFEGFEYDVILGGTILFENEASASLPDGVAVLNFSMLDPLAPWCELQTPEPGPGGTYSCAPDFGGSWQTLADGSGAMCEISRDTIQCDDLLPPDLATCEDCDFTAYDACLADAVAERVNCDKLYMCRSSFCECTASSCSAPLYKSDMLQVRRIGDELIGVFEGTKFKNARGLNVPLGEVRLRLQP